jgi:hypothetical protein
MTHQALLAATSGKAAKKVVIPVATKTAAVLSSKGKLVERLLKAYGAALEQGHRTGRAVRFMVDVAPRGTTRITPVAAAPQDHAGQDAPRPAGPETSLAAARARGQMRVAEILGGDDMLSADELARLLGTTRATINSRRQNHQLLGLEGMKRGFRFPEWQIGEDGKPFDVLPALFERLGESPWAVYRFLVQHHPELDGLTGRDALRRGHTQAAIDAAESVARAFA